MIWKSPNGCGIIVNHKVFSSEIALRIGDPRLLAKIPQRFRGRIHSTIPLLKTDAPLHLLVADPVAKFHAACREDRVMPWVALVRAQTWRLSLHFAQQSRLLHFDNQIHLYRAPDHVLAFWETVGLGEPPAIYTKENTPEHDDEIRSIYAADQTLFDSIKTAGQIADKLKIPPILEQLKTATHAAHRFARSGFAATSPEILAAREATCRACHEWDAAALNATGRCRKCGCSTWAKLRMATESCPLGKWKAISSASALPAPPREPPPAEPLGKLI